MGKDTTIEWCDSTVTPVPGCDGCELSSRGAADAVEDGKRDGHCYAEQLHRLRAGRPGYAPDFFTPTMFAGRMAAAARWSDLRGTKREGKPWLDGMPRVIFVNDMGDALSRSIPFEFLRDEIVANVASEKGRRHLYLWLTKRPRRMAEFSRWLKAQGIPWPANLWPGTSVTSDATINRGAYLLGVDGAPGYFLSCEPLLGPLVLQGSNTPDDPRGPWPAPGVKLYSHMFLRGHLGEPRINFVILGGESGPSARPCDVAWIRSVVEQCRAAGVPVFVKQLGTRPVADLCSAADCEHDDHEGITRGEPTRIDLRDPKGGDMEEWPADLRVREMPRSPL